ncbi:MAG: hypothetical protein HDS36_01715 [Bacteroides sp.]|nr:hypothetical protein [Bacteroides sp.]
MKEFEIYRNGNLFTHIQAGMNDTDTSRKVLWGNMKVEYSGSLVYATFEIGSGYNLDDKYDFDKNIEGEIYHESGFGKVWNLGWDVSNGRDRWDDAKVLSFSGGAYTTQFAGEYSIVESICSFLNRLYEFDDINDYIHFYENLDRDRQSFLSQETKDQILELAELIQLCEKYSRINPNKPFLRELNSDIEKRIKWILSVQNTKK